MEEKIKWIIQQHKDTNHFYDTYLPYEFHLKMVVNVAEDFKYLMKNNVAYWETIILSCWGHDLIEDCRVSYNDVKKYLDNRENYKDGPIANIIYAVTNEKGKNRSERANDKYYEGIRNTPGADFVKLCDRIANVQYSKMTKSDMFEKYKKENDDFIMKVGWDDTNFHPYFDMISYLVNLFD